MMTDKTTIENALQKIVPLTQVIYESSCAGYTVNWEDILAELEECISKGYAPSDTHRFSADLVQVIRQRAEYMQTQPELFRDFTSTGEAAEYMTLFAVCKVGIASTGETPRPFIQAALTQNAVSLDEHLMDALVEAGTSTISENGEDETPPLIDASFLLLDETGVLSALICQARELIEDPAWVTHIAINHLCKSVGNTAET